MATDVVHTLKASAGDYSLMSVWESTEQRDLTPTGLDETETLECDGFVCVDDCVVSGWTTSLANNITIKAAAGHEANGVFREEGGTGFVLSGAVTAHFSLYNDVVVQDIQSSLTASGKALIIGATATVERCLFYSMSQATSTPMTEVDSGPSTIRNCALKTTGRGIDGRGSGGLILDNCTIDASGQFGGLFDADVEVRNTAIYGGSIESFFGAADVVLAENNASSDSTAPGSNPQTGLSEADFEDYSTVNLVPAVGGKLDGTGADLSADFTTDITGTLRTVPWEIGAYAIAGAPPIGIQEMYVNIGGTFTKATPSVLVGGVWQPADAYVLVAGVWKPVYEQ